MRPDINESGGCKANFGCIPFIISGILAVAASSNKKDEKRREELVIDPPLMLLSVGEKRRNELVLTNQVPTLTIHKL